LMALFATLFPDRLGKKKTREKTNKYIKKPPYLHKYMSLPVRLRFHHVSPPKSLLTCVRAKNPKKLRRRAGDFTRKCHSGVFDSCTANDGGYDFGTGSEFRPRSPEVVELVSRA
jgi:hypothetical protein